MFLHLDRKKICTSTPIRLIIYSDSLISARLKKCLIQIPKEVIEWKLNNSKLHVIEKIFYNGTKR